MAQVEHDLTGVAVVLALSAWHSTVPAIAVASLASYSIVPAIAVVGCRIAWCSAQVDSLGQLVLPGVLSRKKQIVPVLEKAAQAEADDRQEL